MKLFYCKKQRLKGNLEKNVCIRGDYKKQKAHGILKNEVASFWLRGENRSPENIRAKTAVLSGSLVLSIPNFQEKNLIGTVIGYGQWSAMNSLHLNQVSPG